MAGGDPEVVKSILASRGVVGMERVVLRTVFYWRCPKCGKGNLEHMVAPAPEQAEALAAVGAGDPATDWCLAPTVVRCSKCGTEFATVDGGPG
jgi:hypothetical protein